MAFTATDASGETQLWVRSLNAVTARRLENTEGASFPFWSSDSRNIAFFASGKLKRTDVYGGYAANICDAPNGRGGSWNREGVIVFAPSPRSPLFRVSSEGGEPKPITSLDQGKGEVSHRWPSFLPDGRHFTFVAQNSRWERSNIYLGAVDSGRGKFLLPGESHATYVSFSGRGYLVFASSGTLMSQPFDPGRLTLGGEPRSIAEHVSFAQYIEPMYAKFSLSENGVLVYESTRGRDQLTWFDQNGRRLETLGEVGTHLSPSLSPDEKQVAISQMDTHTGIFGIWRIDCVRGTESRLTFDRHDESGPVWSPDGSRLAFASRRQGVFDLYEKLWWAGGDDRLLLKSSQWKFTTDWSPDGRFLLYYEINTEKNRDIWALPLAVDAKPIPLVRTEANEADAVFSPDGKWFAYSSDVSGRQEVYVQAFPPASGRIWMISSGGGSHPKWPRDGKTLFYLAPDHKIMAVDIRFAPVFQAGVPRAVFHADMVSDFRTAFAVAARGQRFLVPTALS